MKEEWQHLREYPPYAVSDLGRVMNTDTEVIKIPMINQQGIPSVLLIRERVQCRRAIAPLVASTFLPEPEAPHYDTPINLDGNRKNCAANNLAWRPRWFAIQYHAQFRRTRPPFDFTQPVRLVQTDEIFEDVREAAVKYGLLEKQIILAAMNNSQVFPSWYTFEIVE
jgi:hypothetical protein